MRVLLDECVHWRLARDIVGHEVRTVQQMGWSGIKNGELLSLASEAFEVFVTVDRNLPFQQDVHSFPIAVIVLEAKTIRLADLKPLIPQVLSVISGARPRGIHRVSAPA
jgi:predicted nuclease of predicted toxin-antitoxin system